MASHKKIRNNAHLFLLFLSVGLVLFGLIMIYNASSFEAFQVFGDKFYYVQNQAIWAFFGFLTLIFLSFFSYKNFRALALPMLIINTLLLIIVLIPGVGTQVLGARRWINIAGFSFQPSEFLKVTLTIYIAAWLENKRSVWPFVSVIFFLLVLIALQPDLGTAIVIVSTAFAVYFVSGGSLKRLLLFIGVALVSGLVFIFSSEYRQSRILTFLNPSLDPLGKSYHVRQILIALGSGGLFGLGLGQSRQKYQYLPESTTDSIFAVIAEEVGFFGAGILIAFFLLLVYLGFKIARRSKDRFGQLLATGLASWIGIQALVNFGAMVSLVPLTGIPLPFISYGGSSLIAAMASIGILINIARNRS